MKSRALLTESFEPLSANCPQQPERHSLFPQPLSPRRPATLRLFKFHHPNEIKQLCSLMRIVYFYQYFTTPKGAWSTRAYEFARRWVRAGDSVTVVTSVYDKSDLDPQKLISRFDIEGIDVRVINI